MAQTIIDISSPNDGLGDTLRHAFDLVNGMMTELYTGKVDNIPGKGLSANDFDDAAQTKLAEIAAGAEVNVQSDLLQADNTQDDFVKNKDVFFNARIDPQIEIYAGTSVFSIPPGAVVNSVLLVRTMLWETDEWIQLGTTLTITKPMTTGNRIQINFY